MTARERAEPTARRQELLRLLWMAYWPDSSAQLNENADAKLPRFEKMADVIEQAILAAERAASEPFMAEVNQMRSEFAVEVWKLESPVAALHDACATILRSAPELTVHGDGKAPERTWSVSPCLERLKAAVEMSAASAEAYTARIREKALAEFTEGLPLPTVLESLKRKARRDALEEAIEAVRRVDCTADRGRAIEALRALVRGSS